jgi:aldehyde dehydrogenase (NAD+)
VTGPEGTRRNVEIDALVQRQRRHAAVLRAEGYAERRDRLSRLRKAVIRYRPELDRALHEDLGKPHVEVIVTEVVPVLAEIDYARRNLKRWLRPRRVTTPSWLPGTRSQVVFEPKGASLILAPWNFPITLTLGPLTGAIAAGCPCIIKPSEFAPATAAILERLLHETFDPDAVAIVQGGAQIAEALLEHAYGHIFFTGSSEVGKKVMIAAARHLTSVTLELGGKSPAIVDRSADIELAATRIATGKFVNAGQTCIAPDYVLVHESRRDKLVERLCAAFDRFGADESGGMTHIVSERHAQRLRDLLAEAVEKGAEIRGSRREEDRPTKMRPVVIVDVSPDTRLMQEEIFGPILPVVAFDKIEQALEFVAGKPNPLALYVFSEDPKATRKILQGTQSGGSTVNDTLLHFLNPSLPFGGAGVSGHGRGHGYSGFKAFSNERAILVQRMRRSPVAFLHPPYSSAKQIVADLLARYF